MGAAAVDGPSAGAGQRDSVPGPAGTPGGDSAASLAQAARSGMDGTPGGMES